jgi:hypothetical protein
MDNLRLVSMISHWYQVQHGCVHMPLCVYSGCKQLCDNLWCARFGEGWENVIKYSRQVGSILDEGYGRK